MTTQSNQLDDLVTDALQHNATLAEVHAGRWGTEKVDRTASKHLAEAHEGQASAFRGVKTLIGKHESLVMLNRTISQARDAHRRMTMPFGIGDGARLLPNKGVMAHMKAMAGFKRQLDQHLDDFIEDYPDLIENAKDRLGKAFEATDFPGEEAIRQRYYIKPEYHPVPDSTTFAKAAGLPQEVSDWLGKHLDKTQQAASIMAEADLYKRLFEPLDALASTLNRVLDGDEDDKPRWHSNTLVKVGVICKDVARLNVFGNQALADLVENIEVEVANYDPDDIRENIPLMQECAASAGKYAEQARSAYDQLV